MLRLTLCNALSTVSSTSKLLALTCLNVEIAATMQSIVAKMINDGNNNADVYQLAIVLRFLCKQIYNDGSTEEVDSLFSESG